MVISKKENVKRICKNDKSLLFINYYHEKFLTKDQNPKKLD